MRLHCRAAQRQTEQAGRLADHRADARFSVLFRLRPSPADLKPENYVFTSQDESSPMRLIDFGCAKVAADDEVISDVAGSPYYCSPEVDFPLRHRTKEGWVCACARA